MEKISIGTALGLSLIGFLTVFIVLILLMGIIFLMGFIMRKLAEKKEAEAKAKIAAEPAPAPLTEVSAPASEAKPAKGSCGDLTLVKVSERDAAMIMTIVANQLNTPLNELRFISIKEAE